MIEPKNNKNIKSTLRSKKNHRNVNKSVPAQRSFDPYNDSGQRKRIYKDVTPEISLNLRLEVVKYPLKDRDYLQEVAETLEEILEAASKGITKLPPRKKYGLQSYMNKAKQMKKKRKEEEKLKEKKKNKKYDAHRAELQERLKQMKKEKEKLREENLVREKEMNNKNKNKSLKKKEIFKSQMEKRMR